MRVNRSKAEYTNVYKECFGTQAGLSVLADLCKKFRVLSSTFDENPNKDNLMEGGRNAILFILEKLSYDEGRVLELQKLINDNQMVNQYDRNPR